MTYILVHGTFDGAEGLEGDKWWQVGSDFHTKLSAEGRPIEALQWSGENSDQARGEGALDLCRRIKAALKSGPVTVIAHSHGGNVAERALNALPSSKRAKVSVLTVGTPFLRTTTPLIQRLSVLDTVLVGALGLAVPLALNARNHADGGGYIDFGRDLFDQLQLWFFTSAAIIAFLVVMARLIAFWGRKMGLQHPERFGVVAHEDDEAIRLLSAVDDLSVRPMGPGAGRRSVRRFLDRPIRYLSLGGFVAGFLAFNAATQDNSVLYLHDILYLFRVGTWFSLENVMSIPETANSWSLWAIMLSVLSLAGFATMVLVLAVLALVREGVVLLTGGIAARIINGITQGALKSSACGMDGARELISVERTPRHAFTDLALPDALSEHLSSVTASALKERVVELRDFLADANPSQTDLLAALDGLFEWNELIHTVYLKDPATIDFLVDRAAAMPLPHPK